MTMLCLFAHHRCASSWSNDILRNICTVAGWRHRVVHNEKDFEHNLAAFCHSAQLDVLTFSNARTDYMGALPPFAGLHLIRDPRDILVSSYFAHRNSHPTGQWPELASHRTELQGATTEEGLMLELECRAGQFADMAAWDYHQENVIECKVETMIAQAAAHFSELLAMGQRMGPRRPSALEGVRATYNRARAHLPVRAPLPACRADHVSEKLLMTVVRRNAFHRKSGGRVPGESDPDHHYRSGVMGGWRNYFFPELTRKFKTLYGDLLIKLGYEQNAQW